MCKINKIFVLYFTQKDVTRHCVRRATIQATVENPTNIGEERGRCLA